MSRAIVIGGGIGGLAAGIALRRAGVDVNVFERAGELREVGAGISLWANALRALEHLGMHDVVHAIGVAEFPAALRAVDGHAIAESPADDLRRMFGDLCLVMHRAELLSALLDALGPEHVHLGSPCVRFDNRDLDVTATFADGSVVTGDFLIGADGLHSVIRAQLHGQQPPTYAGYTSWRAVTPFEHARLKPGETWGRGVRFGNVPMSGGRVYWFAAADAPAGEHSPDGEKAFLLRLFKGWHAPIEELINATPESAILRNDLYDRPVLRRWGEGRVTLLGDAAHPMTPNLGQGGCQALEDAVVLGLCIRQHSDATAALREYEAQRIPRANALATQSRFVGNVAQWSNPIAVTLRDTMMGLLSGRMQANGMRAAMTAPFADLPIEEDLSRRR